MASVLIRSLTDREILLGTRRVFWGCSQGLAQDGPTQNLVRTEAANFRDWRVHGQERKAYTHKSLYGNISFLRGNSINPTWSFSSSNHVFATVGSPLKIESLKFEILLRWLEPLCISNRRLWAVWASQLLHVLMSHTALSELNTAAEGMMSAHEHLREMFRHHETGS